MKEAKKKTIKIPINIIDSPRRKYSVFIGASILSNVYNSSDYESYWISRKEWKESGPRIVKEKCKTLIR